MWRNRRRRRRRRRRGRGRTGYSFGRDLQLNCHRGTSVCCWCFCLFVDVAEELRERGRLLFHSAPVGFIRMVETIQLVLHATVSLTRHPIPEKEGGGRKKKSNRFWSHNSAPVYTMEPVWDPISEQFLVPLGGWWGLTEPAEAGCSSDWSWTHFILISQSIWTCFSLGLVLFSSFSLELYFFKLVQTDPCLT